MKVYKFGGASVCSKEGVENLYHIVSRETNPVFVVISAMGKTTNALEEMLELVTTRQTEQALTRFAQIEAEHRATATALFEGDESSVWQALTSHLDTLCAEVREILNNLSSVEYDVLYDRLVGYGELFSTTIVSAYFQLRGTENQWFDMRQLLITDGRHREANINVDRSQLLLRAAVNECAGCQVFVGQGFIASSASGHPTTLGREGSDYSAAMVGYLLDAESVTIWKDVEGILNADPRLFAQTIYLPQLTYLDAVELAYSGAQVIHPKTIKPLQNKQIPLYVRPFSDPTKPGTVICQKMDHPIGVPIYILKQHQVLISIRPKDFSFVLEERLVDIFSVFGQYRQKINLIQSSAVNLSLCVDESRHLQQVVDMLQVDFRVVYNRNVELLTIRGYDAASSIRYAEGASILLVQKTRRTLRAVRVSPTAGTPRKLM